MWLVWGSDHSTNGIRAPPRPRIVFGLGSRSSFSVWWMTRTQSTMSQVSMYNQNQDASWVFKPPKKETPNTTGESVHLLGLSFLFCELGIIITPILNTSIVKCQAKRNSGCQQSLQTAGCRTDVYINTPGETPKKDGGKVQMSLNLLLHLLS